MFIDFPTRDFAIFSCCQVELSLIFQELRTQALRRSLVAENAEDTLRKFENGSPEALKSEMNVGETFADLLDRAAGLSQGSAAMNPGTVMPCMGQRMAGALRGMLSPPGSCGAYRAPGSAGGEIPRVEMNVNEMCFNFVCFSSFSLKSIGFFLKTWRKRVGFDSKRLGFHVLSLLEGTSPAAYSRMMASGTSGLYFERLRLALIGFNGLNMCGMWRAQVVSVQHVDYLSL